MPRPCREDPRPGRPDRVPERDARAIDVRALPVGLGETPLPRHRERLHRERLVDLDEVHVGESELGAVEGLRRRRHRADAHPRRLDAGTRPRHHPHDGHEPQLRRALRSRHDAGRRRVVLAARVSGGHRRIGIRFEHDGAKVRKSLERRVGTRGLIDRDDGVAPAAWNGHGHDLVIEDSSGCRGDRALLRSQRVVVLLATPDFVLPAEVLRRLDHPPGHREESAAGGLARTAEGVTQEQSGGSNDSPARLRRIDRRLAHRLDAARDREVTRSGLHLHHRVEDRLQAGAATSVDLGAPDRHREPGIERGYPGDGRRLGRGIALPEDHVLDVGAVEARPG